jgi:hypothetical protein
MDQLRAPKGQTSEQSFKVLPFTPQGLSRELLFLALVDDLLVEFWA